MAVRIVFNTRFLLPDKLEGIGWFTYETLKRITTQHSGHEYYFLFDRSFDRRFLFTDSIVPLVVRPQARHPLLWYWWFEHSVPAALRKIKPDLFVSTDGYCSLSTSCPQLLVIHDLAFEHFSDQVDPLTLRYYRCFTPRYARKARRIVTVSEFTKKDVVETYGIDPLKIDVAYNGGDEVFRPLSQGEKEAVRNEFSMGKEYFLYAGAIQPRKNIINLLRAFERFKLKTGSSKLLLLAGRNWSYHEAMKVHAGLQCKNDVVFYGHLTRAELSRLMGGAFALSYISLFEGFGIPIVEAMSAGVPVITSGISSMPEVAGDAALLVNPHSVEDISDKMTLLETDRDLHRNLIERGQQRRTLFSWQKTADALWNSICGAVNRR